MTKEEKNAAPGLKYTRERVTGHSRRGKTKRAHVEQKVPINVQTLIR